ncbi:hypothetical protein As57867_004248, partial [Aphanomyces stellatus]
DLDALPVPDESLAVVCDFDYFESHYRNDNKLVTRWFYVGQEYPLVEIGTCTKVRIPEGVALVGFERPWFLGPSRTWQRGITSVPRDWLLRLRSLRVVVDENPPPWSPTPSTDSRCFPTSKDHCYYTTDDIVPAVAGWDQFFTSMHMTTTTPPPGLALLLFPDYNFQGVPDVYDHERPLVLFFSPELQAVKSYAVVATTDNNPASASHLSAQFAGFYPFQNELALVPIFLRPKDQVAALIYPWSHNIVRVSVPEGLVAVVFDTDNFAGRCLLLTQTTDLDAQWNTSVRSFQVYTRVAEGLDKCQTTTPNPQPPTTTTMHVAGNQSTVMNDQSGDHSNDARPIDQTFINKPIVQCSQQQRKPRR